ncbi:uncharacterized protein Z518_04539 [Rhinocladiella mackenziei CBS 650.93]|uniref:Rhinocladiella mackenziei CBS 650.93 unplaced genomic scaffold supercont1.3, whole genome shotgun sequence n=1 Tax=Rhinocladiella mackenziei CBS 650.93 TaxID=1442369 RepID=A0A0D2H827_9EURO|nr:uncharacterized protein Z518_04539 [Rhinocladiella mackenziei CBS 650.93]KIX06563.1 hypothetical protein Z518_04539 [Rhinocladiella mackenziei CBS 650.93]
MSSPSPVRVSNTPKRFPFFDLPGEIRNKIYDLMVPKSRVVITGSHPQKELAKLKSQEPWKKHKLPRYRLSETFTGDATGLALLFTCRQMNREAVEFIYSRITFCFDRIVTVNKFLNVIPTAGARSIEDLEIAHNGYGEPQWMVDREWKFRYDAKWRMLLVRIKQEVPSLQRLSVNLTVFDWPCRLETTERWARPLLDLAGDGLDLANVKLLHDRFHPEKTEAAARELENRMMTPEGRKKKVLENKRQEELERKRKQEARKKAQVLAIKIPLQNKTKTNMSVKKVVKSKGLQQYSWVQPSVAYC